jgi:radical SAM superfamily enzyme YgiQ (UPF0313 family)
MRIKLILPQFHGRHFWDLQTLANILDRKANNLLLGLPTVAALTPAEHDVVLIDERVQDIDYDEPVDLVGLTAMTCYANRAFEIADEFRARGVPVVMGGPHATLAPYEALEHCDAVVIGEAENVWTDLLTDFEGGGMKEVYRGVDVRSTLESRPAPRWGLVADTDYVFFGVEATRGCPFDCSFCSIKQIYGPEFRTRPVDEVLEEIRSLPSNQIFFTDDNLIGRKPFAKELFTRMKGWDVSWGCQMSVNVGFMPEMLSLMQEAGCFFVFIGLESLDKEAVVKEMGKGVNRLDYRKAIANIQAAGIHVIGSFIVGSDGDTPETFDEIADFVQETRLSWVMVNILNSPPGTRLLKEMEAQGRNRVFSYDELDGAHATVTHPTMARDEIEEGFRHLYRSVYDWDSMRERLCASLSEGTWRQNSLTLTKLEQARIGGRLLWSYLVRGSGAQRRFFWAVVRKLGRTVNLDTIVNVLLLALAFHEFAQDLEPRELPLGDPIRFREEYMTPVDQQVIGLDGLGSGVARTIPRMVGPQRACSPNEPPAPEAISVA